MTPLDLLAFHFHTFYCSAEQEGTECEGPGVIDREAARRAIEALEVNGYKVVKS